MPSVPRLMAAAALLLPLLPVRASAGPYETGRAKFFAGDFVGADVDFADALATAPASDDDAARAFRTATRLLRAIEEPRSGPDAAALESVAEVLDSFGFPIEGRDLSSWTSQPPRDANGELALPADSPPGAALQRALDGFVLEELDAALADLAQIPESFALVLAAGEIEQLRGAFGLRLRTTPRDVALDWGDLAMYGVAVRLARIAVLLGTAYGLDVDVDELLDPGFVWELQRNVLDEYPALLRVTPSGSSALAEIRSEAIVTIDAYLAASAFVRGRGDDGAIYVAPGDLEREARLRDELIALRAAIDSCTTYAGALLNVSPCVALGGPGFAARDPRELLPAVSYEAHDPLENFVAATDVVDPTFGGLLPGATVEALAVATGGRIALPADRLSTAPALVLGATPISWRGASPSGGPDLWFRHTAPATGSLTIELCREGISFFNADLFVYRGVPDGNGEGWETSRAFLGGPWECSEQRRFWNPPVSVDVAAGETIYLRARLGTPPLAFGLPPNPDDAVLLLPEPGGLASAAAAIVLAALVRRRRPLGGAP